MYENLAYDELKNLPEDKKAEAWGELHSSIPSNKELALKLGISPIVVVNAVKKYVLGEPVGRANKKLKPEIPQIQEKEKKSGKRQKLEEQAESKPKRKYNKKAKSELAAELSKLEAKPEINETVIFPGTGAKSFWINIKNTLSGEEARVILKGIGNSLLKDRKYNLEIRISEK